MTRCSWCNHILWPFQKLTEGGTMHIRCGFIVSRITAENQQQYWQSQRQWEMDQAELRWEEEDRL